VNSRLSIADYRTAITDSVLMPVVGK